MPKNKKAVPIKYTSRDFQAIKNELVEYSKRYYPDTFRDFNEASFGALLLDTVAYVGDMLSFYIDYQANESFLDTAVEFDNILKLGRQLGFKFQGSPSSYGTVSLYVKIPAASDGAPNYAYAPILLKGTQLSTPAGTGFILNENVDFADASLEVVVADVNQNTGLPVSYAVKSFGQVISGRLFEDITSVGNFEKFRKVELSGKNITEVLSVFDAEGHEYFEVEYLSQNVIYREIPNADLNRTTVPFLLKPQVVPRRFVLVQEKTKTYIQFGHGSDSELATEDSIDPANVALNIYGRDHVSDTAFDPSKLLQTDKFGIAPTNTNLRIIYRSNSSNSVNIAAEALTSVTSPRFKFRNTQSLNTNSKRNVISSLEVANEKPIVGDVTLPNSEELKRRIFDTFSSQNRAVTKQDYISMIYSMPPKFGAIKRANIIQDHDSFKRNLNLYVVSESVIGTLEETNTALKNNLKIWLNRHRMINDTVDILNARIANIGIKFLITAERNRNKYDVLAAASSELRNKLAITNEIGEPFYITDIYKILNDVNGVVDVIDVKIERKIQIDGDYSSVAFDIDRHLSLDKRYINVPEDIILEIKYPKSDIQGAVS
jgi:hypothetical protein